jgi:hypothetical protein
MTFKNTLSSTFLALSLIALVGCNSDVEDVNSKSTNTTFEFGSVEIVSSETYASDSNWPDLKDKMTVGLRACLIDTIYQEKIVGEDFDVSSDLSSNSETTNINGCVKWTEELDFNFLHDETYYKIDGTITGESNYKGQKPFSIAINPWSEKVVDLDNSSVSRVKSIHNMTEALGDEKYLEAEDVKITILNKNFLSNETQLNMAVALTPVVLRNGLKTGIVKSKLSAGEFNVKYFLIEKNMANDTRKVLSEAQATARVRRDGVLKANVDFTLKQGVGANSKIELGISLSANRAISLGVDQGIVPISKLSGTFGGELIETHMTFSQIKSFQKERSLFQDEDEFGFVMDTIEIQNGSEGGANLSNKNSERNVDAIFNIRMVDSLIREDIKNQYFKVEVIDLETNEIVDTHSKKTLTGSGHLQFRSNIPFKSYEKRQWKDYMVRVSGLEAPFSEVKKERVVHINPWLKSTDFGIDSKLGVPPTTTAENTPEIFIQKFDYWFAGNAEDSFRLNKNLDLLYKKTVVLEMEPKLRVAHDYDGISKGYERIINGKYKVRFLILAPKDATKADYTKIVNINDYYTLTAAEAIVEAENGVINTGNLLQLPITFADQAFYALKNVALVEISPVDSSTELQAGYFVGTMVGTKKDGTVGSMQGTGKRLSTGNLNIAKSLISRIDEVNHKLAKDNMLKNSYNQLAKEYSRIEHDSSFQVPVFDKQTFKVKPMQVSMKTSKTSLDFKRTHNLKASVNDIRDLIESPEEFLVTASAYANDGYSDKRAFKRNYNGNTQRIDTNLNMLCHILYNKFAKYTQSYLPRRDGSRYQTVTATGLMFKKCMKNPAAYIELQSMYHVNKITKQPYDIKVETFDLTRSVAYFVSQGKMFNKMKGTRNSKFFGLGGRAGLGTELFLKQGAVALLGGLMPALDAGVRWESFTMDSVSDLVSDQKRLINQDGLKMDYDRFDVSFGANTNKCLLIGGKFVNGPIPNKDTTLSPETKRPVLHTSNKRYYVCLKKQKEVNLVESWYFMKVNKVSEMADENMMDNTHVQVIRGESNFERIRKNQVETQKDVVFVKVDNKDVLKKYKKHYENKGEGKAYSDQIKLGFPGLIQSFKTPVE